MTSEKQAEIVLEDGKKISLSDKNYVASGGEGRVFQRGGTAYKIMHPGKTAISSQKIQELTAIQDAHVLVPQERIYDNNRTPIGFSMRYVHDVEFLCKLLNIGFRQKTGITEYDIVDLIRSMQETLTRIHRAQVLVVDFNQMNFVVDKKTFTTPYFIDCDSYQTTSFKATALMECVRDRKTPINQFTPLSDWYSFACIALWLYIGTHPYRGAHPDYKKKDWNGKRMDDGISLFDPNVTIPQQALPLSVIPKPHLEWFKKIFKDGDRSIPPMPDGQIIVTPGIRVKDVGDFIIDTIMKYDSNVRRMFMENGTRFAITADKLWQDGTPAFEFTKRYEKVAFCKLENGGDPLLAIFDDGMLKTFDWKTKSVVREIVADDMMVHDGKVYTSRENELVEHTCQRMNKVLHSVRQVAKIFGSAAQLYDGVVVEDLVGKCRLTLPNESGDFVGIFVPELDSVRIIDAKFLTKTCVLITEKSGKYTRYVLTFSGSRTKYHVRTTEAAPGDGADFIVKGSGLCIAPVNEDGLETWKGDRAKLFTNGMIPAGSIMYRENDKTMFVSGDTLLSLRKK